MQLKRFQAYLLSSSLSLFCTHWYVFVGSLRPRRPGHLVRGCSKRHTGLVTLGHTDILASSLLSPWSHLIRVYTYVLILPQCHIFPFLMISNCTERKMGGLKHPCNALLQLLKQSRGKAEFSLQQLLNAEGNNQKHSFLFAGRRWWPGGREGKNLKQSASSTNFVRTPIPAQMGSSQQKKKP